MVFHEYHPKSPNPVLQTTQNYHGGLEHCIWHYKKSLLLILAVKGISGYCPVVMGVCVLDIHLLLRSCPVVALMSQYWGPNCNICTCHPAGEKGRNVFSTDDLVSQLNMTFYDSYTRRRSCLPRSRQTLCKHVVISAAVADVPSSPSKTHSQGERHFLFSDPSIKSLHWYGNCLRSS